jgi:hypothetical protein
MRLVSLAAAALLLPLAGCATAPADGSQKIQTTQQANQESLPGAVAAPLRDVNVLRTKIPEVLLEAMTDPYARPVPANCRRITALVRPLDGALGADLDQVPINEDDLMDRSRGTAFGVVASLASESIPFRGWVRKLSGAERHDQLVQAAIVAGAVRRAYLKGLGETRGCKPPATPSHALTQTPNTAPTNPPPARFPKPRYPNR